MSYMHGMLLDTEYVMKKTDDISDFIKKLQD